MTRRPARALAPWMDDDARARLDRGPDPAPLPDAALALGDRTPLDQTGLIAPLPDALAAHGDALRAGEGARRMFDEGWAVAWVTDLRRLVAAQPLVVTDRSPGEPDDPPPGDPLAVAQITLPLAPPETAISSALQEAEQTWRIASANPNLRISGTFGGEVAPGVMGFGFLFSVMTSYVSVAEWRGRLVLRDGYHRAYRLLAAGIFAAPAFVRRLGDDESPFRSGMLAPDAYLGDRPPTLADYHDDAVAVDAWIAIDDTHARVAASPAGLAIGTIA